MTKCSVYVTPDPGVMKRAMEKLQRAEEVENVGSGDVR